MKFDTIDKKPKLYNLLILSCAAAAVIGILLLLEGPRHPAVISFVMIVYLAAALVLLVRAFFGQIHYNPYSYNTIIYAGFFLFILTILITYIILACRQIRWPEDYQMLASVSLLMNSAKRYMLISSPFILVFSGALCVSNISLIRHEGKRFVNVLGILLSFLMIGGEVFLFLIDYYVSGSQREVMFRDLFSNLFAAVYLYFECMIIGSIIANLIVVRYEPEPDKDFLIILGCGLRKDGTPSPLLKGRADRALAFRKKQLEQTGKDLIFVTSGGQGPDEVISESASLKRYLMEQDIPEDRIIEENRSSSTFENMKFSKDKIDAVNAGGKIAFTTTNYHVFRSGLFARRVKMRAVGMGARTKWYFWPNAAVREFVGLLTEHRIKQLAVFVGMLVFYTLLTLLNYR